MAVLKQENKKDGSRNKKHTALLGGRLVSWGPRSDMGRRKLSLHIHVDVLR